MKAAVADHLYDTARWLREFQSERHAAGKTEAAACQPHIALRPGALQMRLQDRPVTDRFIEDDVVLGNLLAERCHHKGRVEGAGNALVGARHGTALRGYLAGSGPAFDA